MIPNLEMVDTGIAPGGATRHSCAWAAAAWVVLLTGTRAHYPWTTRAHLAAANRDHFGMSLAISGDTAIVGTHDGDTLSPHHRGINEINRSTQEYRFQISGLPGPDGGRQFDYSRRHG